MLGEFQYVEAEEFIRTWYLPLVTNDTYNGKYVAIVGMPNQADIPAVSEWGLIVMTLLMLTSGTLVYQRRVPAPSAWVTVHAPTAHRTGEGPAVRWARRAWRR